MPELWPAGIARAVTLSSSTCGMHATALTVVPRVAADLRSARLELRLRFEDHNNTNEDRAAARVKWTVTPPGPGATSIVVVQSIGASEIAARAAAANISVANINASDFWSPVGYGTQARWTLTAEISPAAGQLGAANSRTVCDSQTRKFGVRRLTTAQNPHLKKGWNHTQYGFIDPVCFKNDSAPACVASGGWNAHVVPTPVPLLQNISRWQVLINNVPVFMRGKSFSSMLSLMFAVLGRQMLTGSSCLAYCRPQLDPAGPVHGARRARGQQDARADPGGGAQRDQLDENLGRRVRAFLLMLSVMFVVLVR